MSEREGWCHHPAIDDESGLCRDCGRKAAIRLEDLPLKGVKQAILDDFERACDEAIAALGLESAHHVFDMRADRATIVSRLSGRVPILFVEED